MAYVVGSTALFFRNDKIYKDLRLRDKPIDLDIIGTKKELSAIFRFFEVYGDKLIRRYSTSKNKHIFKTIGLDWVNIIEFEVYEEGSAFDKVDPYYSMQWANHLFPALLKNSGFPDLNIPDIDFLFTLKKTHRFLKNSPHFYKNLRDYTYLKEAGHIVPDYYQDFFIQREKETYQFKTPKLNVKKSEFFTDDVPYKYDHDSIHHAVKHMEKPAYEYYKPDNNEVMCSRELFFSLPEAIRLFGCIEECYVLALERHQIPNDFIHKPSDSFKIAYMKVCSSITSGWFREFSYENWKKIWSIYTDKYVDKFKQALSNGIVKEL